MTNEGGDVLLSGHGSTVVVVVVVVVVAHAPAKYTLARATETSGPLAYSPGNRNASRPLGPWHFRRKTTSPFEQIPRPPDTIILFPDHALALTKGMGNSPLEVSFPRITVACTVIC